MRKTLQRLFVGILLFTLVACSSGSSKDGKFVGEAKGANGPIKVEVTVKKDAIENIKVIESSETDGVSDLALKQIPDAIIKDQGLDVDAVTGASSTSKAVVDAVKNALEKSSVDIAAMSKVKANLPKAKEVSKTDYDVVVIGGGGAGLSAAITAAEKGSEVVLLEKLPVLGGNTMISGGEMAAPGNWLQKEQNIKDSNDQFYEDIIKGGDAENDPELVRVLADNALSAAEWLRDDVKVEFEDYLLFFGGHSVKRSLVPKNASGAELVKKLEKKAKDSGVTLLTNADAKKITAKDGKDDFNQVEAKVNDKDVTFSAKKGIVVASGGFGANLEMRKKYNKDMDEKILSTTSTGSMGDGIVIGEDIGAGTTDMEYIQTYPTCDPETGRLLYVGDVRMEGLSILVNKEGKRFVEELERRDVISKAVTKQSDGHSYMFWDQAAMDKSKVDKTHKKEYESLINRGLLVKADTVEEAAKHFEIDAKELQKTVDTYNQYAKDGKDKDFNKRGELVAFGEGPYYIMKSIPAVHHTMGGLTINTKAQLVDGDKKVIPHVYAAGEVTGDVHGTNRLGSDAIADIIVFGRIAGEEVTK
ncbi:MULTISPECIES: flavocytochrome c [Vagococcus]|uniref:Urocanate reductase n=1 Tax=Vagococcus fluvialis bH819 TaxID=1255619 RepID=A0A1X6WPI3_9ENTE|nr:MULTISPECIES: flavocytochrome c [Vagococcus]SLM86189.1 Fumarate reductase flavoprotein subunit [Vagococcus fluvialis bH819]HCM89719.1 flavocytochrome c [Vagococcus sp.]